MTRSIERQVEIAKRTAPCSLLFAPCSLLPAPCSLLHLIRQAQPSHKPMALGLLTSGELVSIVKFSPSEDLNGIGWLNIYSAASVANWLFIMTTMSAQKNLFTDASCVIPKAKRSTSRPAALAAAAYRA